MFEVWIRVELRRPAVKIAVSSLASLNSSESFASVSNFASRNSSSQYTVSSASSATMPSWQQIQHASATCMLHDSLLRQTFRSARADFQSPGLTLYAANDQRAPNFQTKRFCTREEFRFAHDANLHQTSNIKRQTLPAKKGLVLFLSPTDVIGPCPGQMIVSSGNVRIFSRCFVRHLYTRRSRRPSIRQKANRPRCRLGAPAPSPHMSFRPGNDPTSAAHRFASYQAESVFPRRSAPHREQIPAQVQNIRARFFTQTRQVCDMIGVSMRKENELYI